ncbi:hypothetical protein KO02_22490 [Sphingobacterium sp. ML3W]|nr:hypothetical protein KO02_22490 [Sphingobacterium sp. ML3W]
MPKITIFFTIRCIVILKDRNIPDLGAGKYVIKCTVKIGACLNGQYKCKVAANSKWTKLILVLTRTKNPQRRTTLGIAIN